MEADRRRVAATVAPPSAAGREPSCDCTEVVPSSAAHCQHRGPLASLALSYQLCVSAETGQVTDGPLTPLNHVHGAEAVIQSESACSELVGRSVKKERMDSRVQLLLTRTRHGMSLMSRVDVLDLTTDCCCIAAGCCCWCISFVLKRVVLTLVIHSSLTTSTTSAGLSDIPTTLKRAVCCCCCCRCWRLHSKCECCLVTFPALPLS